jgi:hypothetical protein
MGTEETGNAGSGVFLIECLVAWKEIAPSYVQATVRPLAGHLRDLHAAGATSLQFREALEIAFQQPGVTKRAALSYAYGIVRRQLGGSS